jgi:hypothetical protein
VNTPIATSPLSFGEAALPLLDNAWRPLPTIGKAPAMAGWSELCRVPWDYDDLVSAVADYAGDYGCGIAADIGHVIIDIDVLDEAIAADIGGVANNTFGATPLIRVGRAPKSVRLYRRNPHDAIRSHKAHPIEVMCGTGMVIAYGIHPDTGQPYRWTTGSSPLSLQANSSAIPLIGRAQLERFLANSHDILTRAHYGGGAGAHRHPAQPPADIHQQLRQLALRVGFERAAVQLLRGVVEGNRHSSMWAVVSSAAGRGFDEGRLVQLFAQYFAGWSGVSREAFEHALDQTYRRESIHV